MAISLNKTAFVGTSSMTIGVSQMFNVTAGTSNPTYVVLSALDRNEYTAKATGVTGRLMGNGQTIALSSIGGDARGAGIVFTYSAATGRYYSATYGYLDQVVYVSSSSLDDVTNLSLFATASLSQANAYAKNAFSLMQTAAAGYLGSVTVATEPTFTGPVPAQATPGSIAAAAMSFVGRTWNMNGCWVLASAIAAEAGVSLPVQSTAIGLPAKSNGAWFAAYNGPAGQAGDWKSMVHTGDIIAFATADGGGHITTCVSGSGSTAMLVDNITYVNSKGQIANPANDGSASDIVIAAPHAASQEWIGVQASSVVIYELDTPIVSTLVPTASVACQATQSLAALFSARDPAGRTITGWQAYDTALTDSLLVNGTAYSAHSAATAVNASSLASLTLQAGATATTDVLQVRAFNGLWWGDWQALTVSINSARPAPPVVALQTPNQSWVADKSLSLTLPGGTFSDPERQALKYTATLSNGQALPGWLTFNATTATFTGTAPVVAQNLAIKVTATDPTGLSASETFTAAVLGAPLLTAQTASQSWAASKPIALTLSASTFIDPQGQTLRYTAALSNGQPLPSWLTFNPATRSFTGTAPATAQSLSISVTATDTSGLATSETFAANVIVSGKPGITVTAPTAPQTWTNGQNVDFILPANTFTDALGLKMTFMAYEVSGPDVTSWLHFNASKAEFLGKVPTNVSGTVWLAVKATDAQAMSATDLFSVTFASGTARVTNGVTSGAAGMTQGIDFVRPANMLLFHT